MQTELFPIIQKIIDDAWVKLDREQITPWAFMTAGPLFTVQDFYGKKISYQGIEFDGSARLVFWGRYIEPFLEDITCSLVKQTIQLSKEKGQNTKLALTNLKDLLNALVYKSFSRMAEIDRNLRGKGNPSRVELRETTQEIEAMKAFITRRVSAEISMYKPKWKINEFYNEHTFLFWLLTLVIGGLISLFAV